MIGRGPEDPLLRMCRRSRMSIGCLAIALLGGLGALAFALRLPDPPVSLTAEHVLPLVFGGMLFSTFLPLGVAIGIGRALLLHQDHLTADSHSLR